MKKFLARGLGVVLILTAVLGLLLSAGGVVWAWRYRPALTDRVLKGIEKIHNLAVTTNDGLVVVADALQKAKDNVVQLKTTSESVSAALTATTPVVKDVGTLVGVDMVTVVDKTRASLDSAATSARLIDDTLGIISALPLIGARYKPDVPLGVSISEISLSLAGLPDQLTKVQGQLEKTSSNLEMVAYDLQTLSGNLDQIDANLDQARLVVVRYQSNFKELQEWLDDIRQRLPVFSRNLGIALTVFCVWLALSQLGLLVQGVQLMRVQR